MLAFNILSQEDTCNQPFNSNYFLDGSGCSYNNTKYTKEFSLCHNQTWVTK